MKSFSFSKMRTSNPYLLELFTKISVSICIIILCFSLSLFFMLKNFGVDILNQSSKNQLRQISNHAKVINSYAITYTSSLFNNTSMSQLMYNGNISLLEILNHTNILNNSLLSTPFVHSMYAYNGNINRFYSINPYYVKNENDFFDKEIVDIIKNIHSRNYIYPIPRKISVLKDNKYETANIYTYIIPEIDENKNKVKNALIVNIKAEFLLKSLPDMPDATVNNSDMSSDIIIIDHQGVIVGNSKDSYFLQNLGSDPNIQKILTSGHTSGSFIGTLYGKKSVITYIYWNDPQWVFISVTPYSYISSTIGKVKTLIFVVFSIFLIFSFIFAFLLSKRLYVPVNSIRDKVKNIAAPFTPSENAGNEFDFIMTELQGMENQIISLESYKNKNFEFLKNEFLKKVLVMDHSKIDHFHQKLNEFNISIDFNNQLILYVLKIDRYSEFCDHYSFGDQYLLKYGLMNISNELTSGMFKCECIDCGADHIIIMAELPQKNMPAAVAYDASTGIIREIQNAFYIHFRISLSGFVSPICEHLSDISLVYQNVVELSNYRIIFGHQCILCPRNIQYIGHFDIKTVNNIIEDLVETLKLGKVDECEQQYMQIINLITLSSYTNIMHVLAYLSSSIFKALNIIENNSLISFELDFITFNKKISNLETITEINEEYIFLFRTIGNKVLEQKSQKTDLIVNTVLEYINMHFMDNTLCLDSLAEMMKISSTHLSKLFRKQTSKTLSDYIKEVRLEKARELLTTSALTIDEILDSICWDNKKYFYTVFKKQYGITPSEYRLKTVVDNSRNA